MATKKYLSLDRLTEYDALIKSKIDEGDASAKTYADNAATTVKNDLLNGAGEAYDTLKELGDLITDNVDAIDALREVASGKADAEHDHSISDVTNLQESLDAKASQSSLESHANDTAKHVSADERAAWNAAEANAKNYTDEKIEEAMSEYGGDVKDHNHDDMYYTEAEIDEKLIVFDDRIVATDDGTLTNVLPDMFGGRTADEYALKSDLESLEIGTSLEAVQLASSMGLVSPLVGDDGSIYVDDNGFVYTT